jgi:phage protein D
MTPRCESRAPSSVRWSMVANKLSVAGRDMAALLIDTRTLSTYPNQTSSEIAQKLATAHGLLANVTPTPTLVGRYYDADHDQTQSGDFSQATNEWDLLCKLGSKEGVIPYVSGMTLYFNPPAANPPVFAATFTRTAAGNLVSNVECLSVERHMTQARDVIVTVRSWHSRDKKTYSATVRTKTKTQSTDPTLQPSKYPVTEPNLTLAQCQALAQKLALDISQHERNVTIKGPSILLMDPRYVIELSGTGTDYDMTYYPQTITYQIAVDGGASTDIQAKFSSPIALFDENDQPIGEAA